MYVCDYPTISTLNFLICENLQKIMEDLLKNFQVSLGTRTSSICLLKSQTFASSVTFNVTRWFNFLVNDLSVFKFQ